MRTQHTTFVEYKYAVSRKKFIVLMFILVDKKAWTQWYKLLSWETNQQVAD